jgi:RIO kinase 2
MISMDHQNAEMYFDRDVQCIKRFFERRFHFVSTAPGPFFKDAKKLVGRDGARRLDAAAEASGFTKKMAKDLEAAIRAQEAKPKDDMEYESEDDEEEEEEGDEEEESGSEAGGQKILVIGGQVPDSEEGLQKLTINDGT